MKALFSILLLGLNYSCLKAQNFEANFPVRGVVKDKINGKGVPFASISIISTQRGTSADEEGNFLLSIKKTDFENKIRISCIGYKTEVFSTDEINANKVVYLNPAENILNETYVHGDSINSVEVVKKAIRNIPMNYRQQPFGLEFFSDIEVVNMLSNDTCKVETILLGYYEGYSPSGKRIFEILQARMTGKDPFDRYYIPAREIYTHDVIAHPIKLGIFNEENLAKIKFHYEGSTIYENDTVYNIAYSIPKPTKKLTGYGVIPKYFRGHVAITVRDYAIIEHEISTDRVSSQIRYRKIDDDYFPYSILSSTNQIPDDHGVPSFILTNQLRLVNVSIENIRILTEKKYEDEFSKVKYDKQFWDSNYPR